MKKLIYFTAAAAMAVAMSCSKDGLSDEISTKDDIAQTETPAEETTLAPQKLIKANSTTTKTSLSDHSILWSAGDVISLFNTNSAVCDYTLVGDGGATSGEFETASEPSTGYPYAIYPSVAGPASEGKIAVQISDNQTYAAGNFSTSYPMAAVSDNGVDFAFTNLATILKINLVGDAAVKSVAVTAAGGEALAGACTVDFSTGTPELTADEGASSTVTLTCTEPVQLSSTATEFTLIVAPGTYSGGFTIAVTDNDGKTTTVSTAASPTTLKAGTFKNFGGTMGVYASDFTNIYILGGATFYSSWNLDDMTNNPANTGDSPEWSSEFTSAGNGIWTWTGVLATGEIKFPWKSSFNDFFGITDVSSETGKGKLVYHPDRTEGDQKYYVQQAGNYTISIDIHKLTFSITANSLYEVPTTLYVIGDCTPGGWEQSKAVEMTSQGDGKFTAEVEMTAVTDTMEGFKFIFNRSTSTWDGIQFAWGLNRLWQGGSDRKYNAISEAGTYSITVDAKNWTYTITKL